MLRVQDVEARGRLVSLMGFDRSGVEYAGVQSQVFNQATQMVAIVTVVEMYRG